jgi:hypothetical protein
LASSAHFHDSRGLAQLIVIAAGGITVTDRHAIFSSPFTEPETAKPKHRREKLIGLRVAATFGAANGGIFDIHSCG